MAVVNYSRRSNRRDRAVPVVGACGHRYVLADGAQCPVCAARAAKARLPEGWITTQHAAAILGIGARPALLTRLDNIRPRRGLPGKPNVLFRVHDIQRVAALMAECEISLAAAINVVLALDSGRIAL